MPNIYDDPRNYVTPGQLPPDAVSYKRQQESLGRTVFVKAFEKFEGACTNCQGLEVVILTPCVSGPHKDFPSGRMATWFDGSERRGAGWYVIHRTQRERVGPDGKTNIARFGSMSFPCPVCQEVPQRAAEAADEVPQWADW